MTRSVSLAIPGKPYTNDKGKFVPMEIRLYDVNGAVSATRGLPGAGGYGDQKKDGGNDEVTGLFKQNNPYGPNGPMRTIHTRYKLHLELNLKSPPLEHTPVLKDVLNKIPLMPEVHEQERQKKQLRRLEDKRLKRMEQEKKTNPQGEDKAAKQEEIRKALPVEIRKPLPLPRRDPIP